ncbi:MAG: ABC transporter substrate-binding protein, partial [Chloroflexi bacterium]|nr:ABC transporter substrate-binding protein [Chloroflexota bacterium]
MSHRRKLFALGAVFVAALSLIAVGCSSADEDGAEPQATQQPAAQPTSPPASQQPSTQASPTPSAVAQPTPAQTEPPVTAAKTGGILLYGQGPNVEHVFHLTYSGGSCAAWCPDVGDPITAYGPDSEWFKEKSITQSFDISPDSQTLTFHLKPGLKFQDGTDVDAQAVIYSLNWALDPQNPVVTASQVEAIDSVTFVDDDTFSIHTSRVFAPIITNLGQPVGMPFSRAAWEAMGGMDAAENQGVPSTGPFMVTEWVSGSHVLFERNPYYHRDGYPLLDGYRWVEIPEDQVRAAGMQAGQLDLVSIGSSALDAIRTLRQIRDVQEFKGFAGPTMDHFNASREPFNDIRVRQAAQMAMDRQGWNQAMTGGEGHVYRGSLLPPTHAAAFQVPEEQYPYPYNPQRAKELLEEYAREKGISLPISMLGAFDCTAEQEALGCVDIPARPITLTISSGSANVARAELSKAYYEAVGFKVEMDIGGGNEATRTFVTKEATFSLRSFGLRPHPSGTFDSYLGYGGYWNNGGWGTSPEQMQIHELLVEAGKEFDVERQNMLYKEAQRIYMEAALGGVRTSNAPSYHFA